MTTTTARKFDSLELIRALAALSVVLFHTEMICAKLSAAPPFAGLFGGGSRGVDLFFVLSGFIIAFIHAGDFGRPERIGRYLYARFVRIYPSVWIVSLAALAVYELGYGDGGKSDKLSLDGIGSSFLLLPQAGDALVNVTWSLKYEIFFYLLFSLSLLHRTAGIAVLLAWQSCVLLAYLAGPPASWSWLAFYLRPVTLEFGIGVSCAAVVLNRSRLPWLRSAASQAAMLTTGTAVFVAGCLLDAYRAGGVAPLPEFLVFGGSAGLIIVSLAMLDLGGRITVPRPLVLAGNASYSIYLVHFSTITLIAAVLAKYTSLPRGDAIFLGIACCGLGVGLAFHLLVDQPIHRYLRRRERRPGPARAEPASQQRSRGRLDAEGPAWFPPRPLPATRSTPAPPPIR